MYGEEYGSTPAGRTNYAANLGYGRMENPIQKVAGPYPDDADFRVVGAFGHNWGAKPSEVSDGMAQTLLFGEIVVGHSGTIRGAIHYDEGPIFSVNYNPE